MCVSYKVACSSLVVACLLTGITATLVLKNTSTLSGQSENNLPISCQKSCEDFYQRYCLNVRYYYILIVQEDKKAVSCMCRPSNGGIRYQKLHCWT